VRRYADTGFDPVCTEKQEETDIRIDNQVHCMKLAPLSLSQQGLFDPISASIRPTDIGRVAGSN